MNARGRAFVPGEASLERANVVQFRQASRRFTEGTALRRLHGHFVSCDGRIVVVGTLALIVTISSLLSAIAAPQIYDQDDHPGWRMSVGFLAVLLLLLWRHYRSWRSWRAWGLQEGSDDLRAAIRHGHELGERLHEELTRALLPDVSAAGVRIRDEHLSHPTPFAIMAGGTLGRVVLPDDDLRAMHGRIQEAVRAATRLRGTVLEVGALSYCAYSSNPCVPVKIRGAHGHIECYYEIA